MIEDLRSGEFSGDLRADVCVVGSGAAGVPLTLELARRGKSVLLLESGGLAFDAEIQSLYEGENLGHPMELDYGRYRVFGGSTTQWTGRCAKLDPIDFETRDWLPYSGWPIGPEDLAPYYGPAAKYCGFRAPWTRDDEAFAAVGARVPALDPDRAGPFVWRYGPSGVRMYANFGADHEQELRRAQNVRVLLNANVVGFVASERGGRIEALKVRSLDGRALEARADAFVLCCGGLENARLLLHSEEDTPGGVGTGRAMLGRFFMQHPRGRIARVKTSAEMSRRLQDTFNVFATARPPQHEIGFALPETVQRREGLLNASAILTYEADPNSGWERAKDGLRSLAREPVAGAARLAGALADPVDVVRNAWRRGVQGRHPAVRTRAIDVVIDLEQAPDPESRVTLGDGRDRLGMRRAQVDWRVSDLERRTSLRFAELLAEEFRRLGLGELELEPWLRETGPVGTEALTGTFHHIAVTRMASDPSQGVVDADCRVHGAPNLFVGGCSVFSTGGHANPTLTIVALALRLADHLAEQDLAG